jgi:hypothetical protein
MSLPGSATLQVKVMESPLMTRSMSFWMNAGPGGSITRHGANVKHHAIKNVLIQFEVFIKKCMSIVYKDDDDVTQKEAIIFLRNRT